MHVIIPSTVFFSKNAFEFFCHKRWEEGSVFLYDCLSVYSNPNADPNHHPPPSPPFWLVIFFLFFSINISSMYPIQHPITSPFVNTLNPGLKYKSVSFPVPIILESRSRGLYIYLCSLVLRPTCTRTWQRARWRTSRLGLLPICLHTSSFKSHRSRAELRVWWM